jgi:hypothetical protein
MKPLLENEAKIIEQSNSHPDRFIHATLFTFSLRGLLRAASYASMNVEREHSARLTQAINDFKKAIPALEIVRNALEHFDDYDQGNGDDQKKNGYWPFRINWDNSNGVLTVGPERSLSIPKSREAANILHLAIQTVCAAGRGLPHPYRSCI